MKHGAVHLAGWLVALSCPVLAGAQRPEARFVPLDSVSVVADVPSLDAPVSVSVTNVELRQVVGDIARQSGASITFDLALPGLDRRVTLRLERVATRRALLRLLDGTPIIAMCSPTGQVVLVARDVPAAPPRSLRGRVDERDGEGPIAGARVELLGTRFAAVAGGDGAFSLGEVPAGDYRVRTSMIGYHPDTSSIIHVAADTRPPALHPQLSRAPIPLSSVLVTPGWFGIMHQSVAAPQTLTREQIVTVPQIGEDIYRAVTRLPGVTANDFSARFFVRGGSGDELYASLDGLELIEPFHLKDIGGAISIVDAQAIGAVALTTGGFTAEYGDRLTGVFTMESVEPRTDHARTSVGLSILNARLTSEGGFAGGRGGWLISARRGYIDLALKLTSASDSLTPRYYDVFGKLQYDLRGGGRLAVHVLRAGDNLAYLDTPDPSIHSRYLTQYAWLTWDAGLGARLHQRTVASLAGLEWNRLGEGVERGEPTAAVTDHRSLTLGGLRQDWAFDVGTRSLLKWGLEVRAGTADYRYHSEVRHLSLDASRELVAHWDTTDVRARPDGTHTAAYVSHRFRLLERLTLETGLRWDRTTQTGDALLNPRLNAAWQLRPGTTIRAAWGRYSQAQSLASLQAQDGVHTFFPAERAEHRVLSLEQELPHGITTRVEAYERRLSHERPKYANVGVGIEMFPEITWDRVRLDATAGYARGLEFLVARNGGRRTDWSVDYALAVARDSLDGSEIPRAVDQRHTLHGDWSIHPENNHWRLTLAGYWHTGWPYTAELITIDTTRPPPNLGLLITSTPGPLYQQRLPAYHRVDVRWTRWFATRSGQISLFVEVYNLLNSRNPRGFYTTVSSRDGTVVTGTGSDTFIPRLPSIGLTWAFGGGSR
jgi:TonB dependent receptor-like, beta-barrel/Carboxypeptidase regulatory-like domain/TonB-dependent Receptor Plug Domain